MILRQAPAGAHRCEMIERLRTPGRTACSDDAEAVQHRAIQGVEHTLRIALRHVRKDAVGVCVVLAAGQLPVR